MNILVIEDEARIASFVRTGLEEQGYAVEAAGDGEQGFEMAAERPWDLIILDIMLPGRDGISVLRGLREIGNRVPVILLTARDALEDRVDGLDAGADDYLTKPFFVEELVARVRAVARRRSGESSSVLTGAGLTLDRLKREARVGAVRILLTAREFTLLEYLMRVPGSVYTRTQILEKVWDYHFDPKTNIIDVYIQRLRTKLADAGAPDVIETVRGVGYRIRAGDGASQ